MTDPVTPTRTRLVSALSSGLTAGLITACPLGRAPTAVRLAWTGGPAVAAAAGLVAHDRSREPRRSPARTAARSTGLGLAVAASQALTIVVDRGLESFLRRRGVRSPRLVMGVVAAVVTTGVAWSPDDAAASPAPAPAPSARPRPVRDLMRCRG